VPLASRFSERPLIAIWELTRACQLRCLHCRAVPRPDPRQLSTDEALALVEQLHELDPAVVVLTGGDILERRDLFAIIGTATGRGLDIAVTPSVTPLLTRRAIRRLADVGVTRIALSLDGPDASVHDTLRGNPGSFAATLATISAVQDVGLPLQLSSRLTRRTVPELPATGHLVAKIAPVLWSVLVVVPAGRATMDQQLDPEACEAAFHYLDDWRERTGLPVETTAAPAFRRVVLERGASRTRPGTRAPRPEAVNDGKGLVFVSHTGKIYPSGFLPLCVGDVRVQRLAGVYRTSPLLQTLRNEDLLQGKCGICPFRALCGGSRARAFAATGAVLAEDPACVYAPPRTCRGAPPPALPP